MSIIRDLIRDPFLQAWVAAYATAVAFFGLIVLVVELWPGR